MNDLFQAVYQANLTLVRERLVVLTWGNVSGIDREREQIAIKPSGVPYNDLRADALAVVALNGVRRDPCGLRPSSDTPTHLVLYRAFPAIGAVCHTHSPYATAFAQAGREIPCLGTTHADHFRGPVPLARAPDPDETEADYETATGQCIVERFASLDPQSTPGVLCAGHGPFTWGATPSQAVDNAIALETIAFMAATTLALGPHATPLPLHIQNKHYLRKHGPSATYGQQ